MQGTTDGELIRQARLDWPENPIETVLDALEACYMNGSYDDMSGDCEAPTGHFYRIERWIVTTDSQGFRNVDSFYDEDAARKAFEELDAEYSYWADEDDD